MSSSAALILTSVFLFSGHAGWISGNSIHEMHVRGNWVWSIAKNRPIETLSRVGLAPKLSDELNRVAAKYFAKQRLLPGVIGVVTQVDDRNGRDAQAVFYTAVHQ